MEAREISIRELKEIIGEALDKLLKDNKAAEKRDSLLILNDTLALAMAYLYYECLTPVCDKAYFQARCKLLSQAYLYQ